MSRRGNHTNTGIRTRHRAHGVLLVSALALVLASCAGPSDTADTGTGPTECTAPAGAKAKDVDPDDSPVKPWRKEPGTELVVEFETGQITAGYAEAVEKAAGIWSRSSCLDAVAVTTCSPGAKCVSVVEDGSLKLDTDAEMDWHGNGGYMESATISLFTRPLGRTSDNGVLATVVHEMGHTFGLAHRLKESDVMNAVTGDDTNPEPDGVDFANLAAIYGTRS